MTNRIHVFTALEGSDDETCITYEVSVLMMASVAPHREV